MTVPSKRYFFIFLIVVIFSVIKATVGHTETVQIGITADVYRDFQVLRAGRAVETIEHFDGQGARRDTVEVLLLIKALRAGGFDGAYEFFEVPNYRRLLDELDKGTIDLTASSVWKSDLDQLENAMPSLVLIKQGEFEAGFYTTDALVAGKTVHSVEELKAMKGVSSRSWNADWQALSAFSLFEPMHVADWEKMVHMVRHNRVDYLLAPFQPNSDLGFDVEKARLVPISGYKIALSGARHFGIHQGYDRTALRIELNKGIQALREKGMIERAYWESGFWNASVRDWVLVNPP